MDKLKEVEYETPRRGEVDLGPWRVIFGLGLLGMAVGYGVGMVEEMEFGRSWVVGLLIGGGGAFMVCLGWGMSFLAMSWPRKK